MGKSLHIHQGYKKSPESFISLLPEHPGTIKKREINNTRRAKDYMTPLLYRAVSTSFPPVLMFRSKWTFILPFAFLGAPQ